MLLPLFLFFSDPLAKQTNKNQEPDAPLLLSSLCSPSSLPLLFPLAGPSRAPAGTQTVFAVACFYFRCLFVSFVKSERSSTRKGAAQTNTTQRNTTQHNTNRKQRASKQDDNRP